LRILQSLGLRALGGAGGGGGARERFEVPTYRVDLEREEDLVEEVGRVRGYDRIPNALPALSSAPAADDPARRAASRAREALLAAGFDEAHNYAFVSPDELRALGAQRAAVRLKNPIAAELSVMRTTLLAGLLRNVKHNLRHGAEELRFFELGRAFFGVPSDGGQPAREPRLLALVAAGRRYPSHWSAPADAVDAYDLKGAVERVLAELGVAAASWSHADAPHLHPRNAAQVSVGEGGAAVLLGALGELHPAVAEALELPRGVQVCELDFDRVAAAASWERRYAPLPQQPAVLRDLAVVVDDALPHARIVEEVRAADADRWVESVQLFDIYRGAPVPEGKKSLAYAIRYRVFGRTLTAEEADGLHARIVERLAEKLGAERRA
jgi:phenylalanyl-tRNA synthetase beta chain